ncbi:trehalase family glycosidase [Paraburkholderia sp. WC7.3g]|uniref:trehalase family glycosidase n=1 Tax=Paraburkholderia sp. WC7.3g TaxID=2991070 RepID=UPI003D1F5773
MNTRFGGDASEKSAGGGEYPLQDGFGWTNGVLRVLMQLYPDAVSSTKRADLPGGAVGVSDARPRRRRRTVRRARAISYGGGISDTRMTG